MSEAPEKIWLQNWTLHPSEDTTWCVDKINDDDIEYILATRPEELEAEIERLRGENNDLFDLLRTTYKTLKARGIDDVAFALSSSIDTVLKAGDK